jgi:hypothetical protein
VTISGVSHTKATAKTKKKKNLSEEMEHIPAVGLRSLYFYHQIKTNKLQS